jgi:hypothetical protein
MLTLYTFLLQSFAKVDTQVRSEPLSARYLLQFLQANDMELEDFGLPIDSN